METRFYIYALGYDQNDCITDEEHCFGDYDSVEEAREEFKRITEKYQHNSTELFENNNCASFVFQIEECEEYENYIECVDIHDDCWIER